MPPSTAHSLHNDTVSRLEEGQSGNEFDVRYNLPKAGDLSNCDAVQVKWK